MNAIFHRTSVRQFEERTVEQEKIEKILKAGMQAPTAGNQQAWEFYVVTNKDIINQLSSSSPYATTAKNAPVVIVVVSKKESKFNELLDVDAAIATENMWLEVDCLDLGAVMMAIAPFEDRMNKVKEILQLPDNVYAFALLPVGYPIKENKVIDRYDEHKVHYIK